MTRSQFPRSIERGPIEACYPRPRLAPLPYFRAQLSAAPLKQGVRHYKIILAAQFPRSIERGPIEAMLSLTILLLSMIVFPRSIERGPIEAHDHQSIC